MSSWLCPFCGSKELKIQTPYMTRSIGTAAKPGSGEYNRQETYCCRSQAQNATYANAHRNPITGEVPDSKELSKW